MSLDDVLGGGHFLAIDLGEVARLAHRAKVFLEQAVEDHRAEQSEDASYEIILCDLNVSTLIEARESDRCDRSHFELFIEETLEDELSESLCVGSGIEEVAEDHVLDELDGCTSCMPLGTGADLSKAREKERGKE